MEIRRPLEHGLQRRRMPFAAVLDGALPDARCAALVARVDALSPSAAPLSAAGGPVMRPDIRNNERVMFDDPALAIELFATVGPHLPAELEGRTLVGFNERFRGYRYRAGQRFAPHFDGSFRRPRVEGEPLEQSELTLLFYLNEGFVGGDTTLLDFDVRVAPRRGSVLAFAHGMYHEGCEVLSGLKYVLRSDAMYRGPERED